MEFKLKAEDVDKNEAKIIPPQLQMDYAMDSTKQLTPVVISLMVDMDKTLEPMESMDNEKEKMPTELPPVS